MLFVRRLYTRTETLRIAAMPQLQSRWVIDALCRFRYLKGARLHDEMKTNTDVRRIVRSHYLVRRLLFLTRALPYYPLFQNVGRTSPEKHSLSFITALFASRLCSAAAFHTFLAPGFVPAYCVTEF